MSSRQYQELGQAVPASYTSLGKYNPGVVGQSKAASASPGHYVVPNYAAPSYNALTHGTRQSNGGYFTVADAYGSCSGGGEQYIPSPCS